MQWRIPGRLRIGLEAVAWTAQLQSDIYFSKQAQLAAAEQRGATAAAAAEAAQKLSAERELLLVAVAPSNGDLGEDAVRGSPFLISFLCCLCPT